MFILTLVIQSMESRSKRNRNANNLKCIILGCQWTYQCSFDHHPQESLRLIELHLEHAHYQQQDRDAAAGDPTKSVCTGVNVGVDEQEWIDNVPAESPKVPCPICLKPYRKFNGKNHRAYQYCLSIVLIGLPL